MAERSQAEPRLHSTSCAYEPSHKSETMLHLIRGDRCLTPHPLPVLATRAVCLFAVISARGRWDSGWRLSGLAWPSVPRATKPQGWWPVPRGGAETGSSALHPCATAVASHAAGVAPALGCSEKAVPLATCNKLGFFQASRRNTYCNAGSVV